MTALSVRRVNLFEEHHAGHSIEIGKGDIRIRDPSKGPGGVSGIESVICQGIFNFSPMVATTTLFFILPHPRSLPCSTQIDGHTYPGNPRSLEEENHKNFLLQGIHIILRCVEGK